MSQVFNRKRFPAFTLAELLIALAILGVIATFTIPKVLTAQQNSKHTALAKEAAGMISGAFQAFKMTGSISANTRATDFTPYMNYVKIITTGPVVDPPPNGTVVNCDATDPCLLLHSGGILQVNSPNLTGTSNLNAVEFRFDPDGIYSGSPGVDQPGVSIQFLLYANGFLTSRGQAKANTCNDWGCPFSADPPLDPSWFSWN